LYRRISYDGLSPWQQVDSVRAEPRRMKRGVRQMQDRADGEATECREREEFLALAVKDEERIEWRVDIFNGSESGHGLTRLRPVTAQAARGGGEPVPVYRLWYR